MEPGPTSDGTGIGLTFSTWVSLSDEVEHIASIGLDGGIGEVSKGHGQISWSLGPASQIAGAPAAQRGALTSRFSTTDNMQHIAYIDGDGNIQELDMHPGQQPWNWDNV